MTRLPDLKEQHNFKRSEMRGLVEAAETASRDLTPEEKTRFDSLKGEAAALEERIARAETIAEYERLASATPVNGELARETRAYSLAKALQEAPNGRLTGREAEVHAELSRGRETRGFMAPSEYLLGETRAQTVSNDPSGGYLVATQLAAVADRFRPSLKTESLGATILRGLSGAIFTYAVRARMRPNNPVHGVIRFADGRRERRLSDGEFVALGAALAKAESEIWPSAIAAARFLALTGWRRGEVLGLAWTAVDLERRTATLSDTKTGRSVRPLSRAACDLLRMLPQTGKLVFPATRGDGP